ncbi:MAG: hypothetical protein RI985_1644 [Chloroflexota bacterium]|jgi:transcriptional regulator GlxA family with amidase domain
MRPYHQPLVTQPTHRKWRLVGVRYRLNELDALDSLRQLGHLLKMIGTWQQGDALSQLQSKQYALGLIVAMLDQFSTLANPHVQRPESLNWVTAYCSFHLAEPLRIADMAARAHLSPSHFTAVFRQRFGMSPHQYVLRLRVQRAQELLRTTQHSLASIAELCGFADVHHFVKTFKRITEIAPGAYRQRGLPPPNV